MSSFNEYDFYDCKRVRGMEVGKKYLVSTVNAVSVLNDNGGAHPWGRKSFKVPVKVIQETPFFYTCMVLPHYAHTAAMGKSKPYVTTIGKEDIKREEFKIYETECELENHESYLCRCEPGYLFDLDFIREYLKA